MADVDANCSEDFPLMIEEQNTFDIENLLKLTEKRVLKWEGNFHELKSFLDSFLKTDTKWSTPRGNCKQYQTDNGLDIRWYSTSKSLCIDGPAGESLKTQLTTLVNNIEREFPSTSEIAGESSNFQTLSRINSGIQGCDPSYVSLDKIAEIFRKLEDRMNERIEELKHEIQEIKLKSSCNTGDNTDMSQGSIHNLIQENASLKDENKGLKERCENLVYAMGALKRDVNNLEEEKKSLLTVIKILQSDADDEQTQQKSINNQNNWNKVKERTVQKHKITLSGNNNEMQINNNTVEIPSDSDDNIINSPETSTKSRQQKNGDKRPTRAKKNSEQSIRQNTLNSATSDKSVAQSTLIENCTSIANISHQEPEVIERISTDPNSAARIIIAGDSMIKNLNGYKMSTRNSKVQVSTFPGCSTLDMEEHTVA